MDEKQQSDLLKRITVNTGLMNGKPTIRGMRFPVADVLEMLSSGMSVEQILDEHPILEREDVQASLLYASFKINNTRIINAA